MNRRELAIHRAALLRPLLEDQGMTYRAAAARLGVSIGSIAGLADRHGIRTRSVFTSPSKLRGVNYSAWTNRQQRKEKAHRAAAEGPPIPTVVDRRPARDRAWDALPGTTPTRERDHDGCRWPLGLAPPFLWCNAPTGGQTYCPAHTTMAHAPVKKGTEK